MGLEQGEQDRVVLEQAIALATQNVAQDGGPFGAVVVRDGVVLATGQNRVTRDHDPTAHAEVCAIRAACQALGTFDLAGCTLYASCEPCPLCLAASLWARVERVVFSANRHDAARAGFDDAAFYERFDVNPGGWATPRVEELRLPEAAAPFEAWLAHEQRRAY